MKQCVLTAYGTNYETLFEYRDVLSGVVPSGSVRVRVMCAGVSFTDVIISRGMYTHQKRIAPLPCVLGFEFSGVVIETHSALYAVGDAVFGVTRFGSWQEEVVVSASYVRRVPPRVSFETAAASVVAYCTAWCALECVPPITDTRSALVTGASGGVGSMLARIIARTGVEVTGLVSSKEKQNVCTQNGVTKVVTRDTFLSNPSTVVDVVFCNDGTWAPWFARHCVKIGGTIVVYGFHSLVVGSWWVRLRNAARLLSLGAWSLIEKNVTLATINILQTDTDTLARALDACERDIALLGFTDAQISVHNWREVPKVLHALEGSAPYSKYVIRIAGTE